MIRKALEYIVGLGEANVKEYVLPDGEKGLYSDKPLQRLETPVPVAEKLYLHTLTGLVDYIKSGADKFADKMIVEVQSPTNVHLYSKLNEKRCREYLIEVDAMVPEFGFDRFYEQENFCIALQSKFVPNEDRELLLKFAGTVKTGLTSKGEALIPNPVVLKPYRTFLEVDQPESAFIFRMKEGCGVECAIFEADGGTWQIEAMQNVKSYLEKELEGMEGFTVIA